MLLQHMARFGRVALTEIPFVFSIIVKDQLVRAQTYLSQGTHQARWLAV